MDPKKTPSYLSLQRKRDNAANSLLVATVELKVAQQELSLMQTSLASWEAAGNSDIQNKLNEVQKWRNRVNAQLLVVAKKKSEVNSLQQSVDHYEAQMENFVSNYEEALAEGSTPNDAEKLADSSIQDPPGKEEWSNTQKIVVAGAGLIAVGLVIFLIIKLKK